MSRLEEGNMRTFKVFSNYTLISTIKADRVSVDYGDLFFTRVSGTRGVDFKKEVVAYFKKDTWTHFLEDDK